MYMELMIGHYYKIRCIRNGRVIWTDEFENMVPEAGRNKYLDATLKTGLASPAWYVGLKDLGTALDADTMASHGTWVELTGYSNTYRPTWTPGSVASSSVDNSASPAAFTISADDTIYGLFLCDEHTKGGATGTLMGVGDLSVSRDVLIGDTINAVIVCTIIYSGS
jgi:hypothetical protein